MDEARYNAYLKASETLSADYHRGYQLGLSHYLAKLKVSDGSEPAHQGEPGNKDYNEGYRVGFAGKPPRGFHHNIGNKHAAGKKNDTNMNIRLPSGSLEAYRNQAQAEGMTLTVWVTSNLDRIVLREQRKAKKAAEG